MSAIKSFRSAFNGFNREDVVHYIEYMNNKHNATINQLNNELQTLTNELAVLRAKPDQDPELVAQLKESRSTNTALSEEVETLRGQIDTLTREAADAKAAQEAIVKELEQANCNHADQDSLRQELDAAKQELADTKLQLEQARQAAATAQLNYELEAYRRAERAERMAGERVNRMYEQVNSILADAALQADENATLIGQAADRFVAQLSELQATIAQSSNTMKDTAAAICAVRPLKPE